jgi:uncharacterized protein YraI
MGGGVMVGRLICAVVAAGLCVALPGWAGTRRTVSADGVNLRAAADPEAEIVGQVARGDTVVATGVEAGEWVEIEAPAATEAYIYGELVRDNVVAVNSVRVRSGPGIGYRPIGDLARGTAIAERGRKGDWIQIVPPPLVRVWINGRYVRPSAAGSRAPAVRAAGPVAAAEPPAAPSVGNGPRTASVAVAAPVAAVAAPPPPVTPPPKPRPPVPVAPPLPVTPAQHAGAAPSARWVTPPPRPLAPIAARAEPVQRLVTDVDEQPSPTVRAAHEPYGLALVAGAPQGIPIRVSGVLRPAGFRLLRPSAYRLVDPSRPGRARTLCYVAGGARVLDVALGRHIVADGRKYWVQGVRNPVVVVDSFDTRLPPAAP